MTNVTNMELLCMILKNQELIMRVLATKTSNIKIH